MSSYESEQEKRLRRIGRSPEADEQISYTNRRLSQIMTEEIAKLPTATKDAIERNVLNSQPPDASDTIINVEIARGLRAIVKNRVEQRLREEQRLGVGYKQQNPMQEMGDAAQNRKVVLEIQKNIPKIRTQRNKLKLMPFDRLVLYPHEATVLSSFITTNNNLVYELAQSGIQLNYFEPLPQCKPKRITWIQQVYNGLILSDSELQQQQTKIAQALRNLETSIIL